MSDINPVDDPSFRRPSLVHRSDHRMNRSVSDIVDNNDGDADCPSPAVDIDSSSVASEALVSRVRNQLKLMRQSSVSCEPPM